MYCGGNKAEKGSGVLRQFAVLNRVIRKGLIEKIFEHRLRGSKGEVNFNGVQKSKGGRKPGMVKKKLGEQSGW